VGLLQRILIANRGEIAIRIARAAKGIGMETVGVFAAADARSLHAHAMDQSRDLTGDPVAAYLDASQLIDIAQKSGCDCVHPGYGFLSESADFAERCKAAGLTFVGPSPAAMALFGNKMEARKLASSLNIPVVPGSDEAIADHQAAQAFAESVGYPIMLKAAGGGGGRGMRRVDSPEMLADALERARSEAAAAFGDDTIFAEKLIHRPRHIEVQVLADQHGDVVHLFERDCSVQLRHQKVIEIAPAAALDTELRQRMLTDAVRLAKAAGYSSAGTVEFLVVPETGEYYFIECNARIQVEHTITEQITGVDLVEAQLRIAGGAHLAELGLADQNAISARGFAVQARIVLQGTGTIDAYREPSGPGIRVDGCAYVGYQPPPEYDPLLGKLICSVGNTGSLQRVVANTAAALREFQISGVATNLGSLCRILEHPDVGDGNARTTLLTEAPELTASGGSEIPALLALLEQSANKPTGPRAAPAATPSQLPELDLPAGSAGVECPLTGSVQEICVSHGAEVAAGETLFVVTSMKMETPVIAPAPGTLSALADLKVGDQVLAGQVLAGIATSGDATQHTGTDANQSWQATLDQVERLHELALARFAEGSEDPGVVRQRSRGKLTCRERIDRLLDTDTFREVGSATGFASYDEDGNIDAFTPANHVGGWGKVDGRTAVVCADDFTSRGGHSDGAIGEKSRYLDELSIKLQAPSVRLLDGSSGGGSVAAMVPKQSSAGDSSAKESSGAIKAGRPRVSSGGGSFLPGHLGTDMYTEQLATVPVVNVLLGSVVGIGAAKAVLGHFSVMVRDIAQLFVAGPPVVSHAMGYDISKEDLGGWHIHCTNGSVDNLAETEDEALAMTKRFLSYLPPSAYEAPPVHACSDPVDRREEALFTLIPRQRTSTFDMRRAIRLMADEGSFFEIGPLWGTDQITGFVRFNGHPLGVIASDSRHINGGAMTANGCDKLRRHLDLCDVFHLPVLNLVDNPGFAVGLEHETAGTIRKGGEWMVAFSQVSVPLFTVVMRRSFGVAGNNYATPQARRSVRVAWPAADVGGIPPEGGIEAAYKRQLAEAEDPAALRAEIEARIESARGPLGPLNRFQMEEMIDPRDTRRLVCEWVETAYRFVTQPARLAPRALQFRP